MAVCRKCDGRKVSNGKTCDNCNGTGFQDGRMQITPDDKDAKINTPQWVKAIRSQMKPKKSK
jgi:hypothetical protein